MAAGKDYTLDKHLVDKAIEKAEEGHQGEILPLVLKQSDLYPAAHFRLALLLGLSSSTVLYLLPFNIADPIWYLWTQIPFLLLGYLLAYKKFFKRLFSTKSELNEEVKQRAMELFYEKEINKTSHRSGILLLISLLEHKIIILPDHHLTEKIDSKEWNKIIKKMSVSLKDKDLTKALINGLEDISELLRHHFPLDDNREKVNEIPNQIDTE